MSEPNPAYFRNPVVVSYLVIGAGSLLALMFAMQLRDANFASLMAVALGVAGLLARWRTAPLALLFAVTAGITDWSGNPRSFGFDLRDTIIAAATLTYLAAQYRLFSLGDNGFPRGKQRKLRRPRPAALFNDLELVWLAALVLAPVIVAQFIWASAPALSEPLHLNGPLVLLVVVGVLVGGGGLLTGTVLAYRRWRAASPDEAALVLQDTLWAETRREQRRTARWLAWFRARPKG